ncbi:MAG: ethanolamine utilization protein EutH [Otoolea sp.]
MVGGQLAFVASMISAEWVTPYMVNKIVAGAVGVVLAVICDRKA